jgi:hypothetical protein
MKKRNASLLAAGLVSLALSMSAPPVVAVAIDSGMSNWTYRATSDKGNGYKLSSDEQGTFLQSQQPQQSLEFSGDASQEIHAANFAGQRVRLSAMIKMSGSGVANCFLNKFSSQLIREAQDWKKVSIVADLPKNEPSIRFGVTLRGGGKLWFKQFTLDRVSKSTKLSFVTPAAGPSSSLGLVGGPLPQSPDFRAESKQWTCHTSKSPGRCGVDDGASLLEQQSKEPTDYIASFQDISAAHYAGKRVKLMGSLKTQGVTDWSGLWMRVDSGRNVLAFDNMANRPIKGDTDWTNHAVVLDVPSNATRIRLGFMLAGSGKAWMKDLRLDEVDKSVPVTAEQTP